MPKITKRLVESVELKASDVFLWDSELRGFGVRVYPSGTRRYLIQWKREGRSRRYVIGTHGPLTAELARRKAAALLGEIAEGRDPAEDRDARKADLTLNAMLDTYLAEAERRLKPSAYQSYASALNRHVRPLLGSRKLRTITRADVEKLQADVAAGRTARDTKEGAAKGGRAIVRGGATVAGATIRYLKAAMNWAVRNGLLTASPAEPVTAIKAKRAERYLVAAEFQRLGEALARAEAAGANKQFVAAVRLLALTGCRKNEVARLTWDEVDLAGRCLRLRDSKTGAKIIPLSTTAAAVIAGTVRIEGSPWVFPSTRGEGPIVGVGHFFADVVAEAELEGVSLHTLRHSIASTAVASGSSLLLVGRALGHSNVTTTGRYAHVALNPVAEVMERASATVAAAMAAGAAAAAGGKGGEVVRLAEARR